MYSHTCYQCSTPFTSPVKSSKFCSLECRYRSQEKDRLYKCPACQKSFEPKRKNQKYCSRICRARGRIKNALQVCTYCGEKYRNKTQGRKYCSMKCRRQHKNEQYNHICPICSKKFQARPGLVFCSKQCAAESKRKNPKRNCAYCGKGFFTSRTKSNIKYCSAQCQHLARRGPEYGNGRSAIYGPRWPGIARQIRRRDNWTCQMCGTYYKGTSPSKVLHVHHKVSVRKFAGDLDKAHHSSNLITLCRSCHARTENRIRRK
jgi:hypothetical protein